MYVILIILNLVDRLNEPIEGEQGLNLNKATKYANIWQNLTFFYTGLVNSLNIYFITLTVHD